MPLNRNSKPLAQPASTKQPIRANGVRTQPGGARPSITTAPPAPASGPRARTWKLLMEAAGELVDQGRMPTVAEVAERAGVSRATAYRYFPSRGVLVTAMIDMALGPVRSWESRETDGRKRVHELFRTTFPRFEAFEPHMRAAVQLSLEQQALERVGLLTEPPYRRGHRIAILDHALAPLKDKLDAKQHERLHQALSLIYGIEPYIVFKDIWNLPQREVEALVFWMVDALLDAALRDAGQPRSKRGGACVAAQRATRQARR